MRSRSAGSPRRRSAAYPSAIRRKPGSSRPRGSAGALTPSLVAEQEGEILGHVAFSPVRIGGVSDWCGLGPVSVRPDQQRKGIGQALVEHGLDRLRSIGAVGCVVFGDPAYYGRFGFESDPRLVYAGAPPRYFQRLVFQGEAPTGEVSYHASFGGA